MKLYHGSLRKQVQTLCCGAVLLAPKTIRALLSSVASIEPTGLLVSQIFISHSQRDEVIKNPFLRAFRGTGVTDVYREYEDAPPTGVKA